MKIKDLFIDFWGDRFNREIISETQMTSQQPNTIIKFIKYKHKEDIKYELNFIQGDNTGIQYFTETEFLEFCERANKITINNSMK
jgi:hypothetical protein